jgi:hypothetical protein
MGKTCQLPLLTTIAPEMGAGYVNWQFATRISTPVAESARFCTTGRRSPQDVHKNAML